MAFTCYRCLKRQLSHVDPDAEFVAQDAQEEGRHADAARIRVENTIAPELAPNTAASRVYHGLVALFPIGVNGPWYGADGDVERDVTVFLPTMGVSVGPCESCGLERPCVNT